MNPQHLDIDVAEFAHWLAAQPSDRLWTVDGEPLLEETLPLPCPGRDLAMILKARGGRVRLFGSDRIEPTSSADLSSWAEEEEEGGLIFELTWLLDGKPGEHWIIAEDTLAEEADRAASHLAPSSRLAPATPT